MIEKLKKEYQQYVIDFESLYPKLDIKDARIFPLEFNQWVDIKYKEKIRAFNSIKWSISAGILISIVAAIWLFIGPYTSSAVGESLRASLGVPLIVTGITMFIVGISSKAYLIIFYQKVHRHIQTNHK